MPGWKTARSSLLFMRERRAPEESTDPTLGRAAAHSARACHDGRDMSYVRVYSDEYGDTHFEDVVPAMTQERYAAAAWLISSSLPVRGMRFRRVTDEYSQTPHVAPRRQFIVHLVGEVEVEVSDGETRRFGPGSVMLVEDVAGKGHTTRRIGDVTRETLFLALED